MESLAESVREQPVMPRFEDGSVNLRELMRRIGEDGDAAATASTTRSRASATSR